MTINEALCTVLEKQDLGQQDAYQVACAIMDGKTTPSQISALLIALRMKGETIDEITGFVKAMREKVTPVPWKGDKIIDTCGTGGDGAQTFNISTVAAFVAAGAGCRVAKHGNRSVSSRCGSADLLECLGVKIDISPEKMITCLERAGISFLFAPVLHRAMKHALQPRQEIGVRTIFNILGPLTNPANARRQIVGVFDGDLTVPIARVLSNIGVDHAMVVHGEDGLDEMTITGKTIVTEVRDRDISTYSITPGNYGLAHASLEELITSSIEENAECALDILKGSDGPRRNIVLLNAGAAIYVGGKADSLQQGIVAAQTSIDTGKALEKLNLLREVSQ